MSWICIIDKNGAFAHGKNLKEWLISILFMVIFALDFSIDCILSIVECTWIRLAVNGACNQCRTRWSSLFTFIRTGRIASRRWCSNRLDFTIQCWVGAANVTMRLMTQRIILRFWINVRVHVALFWFFLIKTKMIRIINQWKRNTRQRFNQFSW